MVFKTRLAVSRFKSEVDEEFVCSLCQGVFEDPVTCCCPEENSHVFCRSCISQSLSSRNSCPLGGTPLTVDTLQSVPRVMKKWIDDLQVRCKFVILGCETTTKLEHLAKHELECSYGRLTKKEAELGDLLVKAQALAIEDAKRDEAVKLMADEILALHTKKTDFENEMQKFEDEMTAEIRAFKNNLSKEIKELVHSYVGGLPAEGVKELTDLNDEQDEKLKAIGRELRNIRREHFPLIIRNPSRQSEVRSQDNSNIVFGEEEPPKKIPPSQKKKLIFEDMFGVDPPEVSDEHIRLTDPLLRELKRGPIPNSVTVLEILKYLDFRHFFPGQITRAGAEKLVAQLEYISDAIELDDNILLIGGSLYLAVCAAGMAGPDGRVFCQNFGVDKFRAAGFGHLLNAAHRRIEFVPPRHMTVEGYSTGAPYDLILTKQDWFNETIRRQLKSDGYALDYDTDLQL